MSQDSRGCFFGLIRVYFTLFRFRHFVTVFELIPQRDASVLMFSRLFCIARRSAPVIRIFLCNVPQFYPLFHSRFCLIISWDCTLFQILRTEVLWRDLPREYGDWENTHRRFCRWCDKGIWANIFENLIDDKDIFGKNRLDFIIFTESARMIRLSESAIYHQTFW